MANTTHTVNPGGGADYTSLSAYEDAIDGTAYSAGETATVNCSGTTADTVAAVFDGWDADVTVIISGDAHTGIWDTGHYRLQNTATPLTIGNNYNIRINNLQIDQTGTAEGRNGIRVYPGVAYNLWISNCIIRHSGTPANNSNGIWLSDASAGSVVNIWNTIVYGWDSGYDAALIVNDANLTVNVYSCTFASCTYGIRNLAGTVVAKNVYAHQTGNGAFSGTITQTTCASSDTTATGTALDSIALSTSAGAYFTNVTVATADYSIGTSSALKDVGTNTSGDAAPLNFTTDIAGNTRATWDVGAFEYVAAGGGGATAPTGFMTTMKGMW